MEMSTLTIVVGTLSTGGLNNQSFQLKSEIIINHAAGNVRHVFSKLKM